MSLSDLALAKAHIRDVIVPMEGYSSTAFMSLPKIHLFEDLRTLNVYMPAGPRRVLEPHALETLLAEPPPEELLGMLKDLGLQVDNMTFNITRVTSRFYSTHDFFKELE